MLVTGRKSSEFHYTKSLFFVLGVVVFGVLFVGVRAVTVVFVAVAVLMTLGGRELVHDRAKNGRIAALHLLEGKLNLVTVEAVVFANEDGFLGIVGKEEGIVEESDRRRIDHDDIEPMTQVVEKSFEGLACDDFTRIAR